MGISNKKSTFAPVYKTSIKMCQDLVSIIMPTFNTAKFVSDSIESVLNQTYTNLELLITDDGSSDGTRDILENYKKKDSRIKVFYLEGNQGAGPARNKCLKEAQGRYIAFCDSDDRWIPTKLEKQIQFIQEKNCSLTYSSYILCDEDNREEGIFIAPKKVTYAGMLRDDKIGFLTALYDLKAVGEKFYFPSLRKRQDWAMVILLLKKCRVAYGLKEPLAYYRLRHNSISRNKCALISYNANVYKQILGFSTFKAYLFLFTIFLPTYAIKMIKLKFDSFFFMRKRKNSFN